MKGYNLLAAGLLLAALPAMGQSQMVGPMEEVSSLQRISSYGMPYLQKAAKTYEACLKSRTNGVVESSITASTVLRVVAPQLDLSEIRSELDDLAASGNTPAIRYKAFLATIVFENPRAFESALDTQEIDSDQFFNAVANQVSRSLFGYKAK